VFWLLCVGLAASTLIARAAVAFGTDDVLDWDETYYTSTTATAAHGLGLYPYVQGYPPIPSMGGTGYIVFLYVLAYKLLGPHLLGLRLVAFVVCLVAVAGVAVLTRRLFGTAAALAALALTPSLLVFQLSNTIRFDVFAIAFVAWVLVLYIRAADRETLGAHTIVGLVMALGLQVHLHTAAVAFAVGLAYVVRTIARLRQDRSATNLVRLPIAGFGAGYVLGLLLFLAINVAPNPGAFFRTAGLARLSAVDASNDLNLTAPMDRAKLAQTFLSPALMVRKEAARYRSLAREMSWWEALLWIGALPVFFLRRSLPPAVAGRTLIVGAVAGAGIVLNSASPLYASAILPCFVPAAASLLTHGLSRQARIDRAHVPAAAVAVLLVLGVAIVPGALARTTTALARARQPVSPPPVVVDVVRRTASTDCVLAGPADLYAKYFMAYPRFVSTRRAEVLIGSTYYNLQDNHVAYWHEKRPDIVFGTPDPALRAYLTEANYLAVADGVWRKPDRLSDGCEIRVR
jgi:4-amino-4-deoxy-L-arabinose transferase-like glycosyltransferase